MQNQSESLSPSYAVAHAQGGGVAKSGGRSAPIYGIRTRMLAGLLRAAAKPGYWSIELVLFGIGVVMKHVTVWW